MIDKEIFFRAIKKAEQHGYSGAVGFLPLKKIQEPERLARRILWAERYKIIFDHDFAKAIWGEEDLWHSTKCTCGGGLHYMSDTHFEDCERLKAKRDYKFHLQQMVLEPEPIKYLEKFL